MKERVGHVQLMGRPVLGGNQCEDSTDGGRLDDWGKSFPKVVSRALVITSHDPPSFVTLESTIGVELLLEDPLAG
jgi:hypothetical protein